MEISDIPRRLALLGRTQANLAAYLGVSKTHLSQLLSGKRRMSLDAFRKIETFLAAAERPNLARGVAEGHPPAFDAPEPSKTELSGEERDRLVQELVELGDAYKLLPRLTALTDEEILGYDENGLPR